MVFVYDEINSALAAARAAVKLHIPVTHIESVNRFGTLDSIDIKQTKTGDKQNEDRTS